MTDQDGDDYGDSAPRSGVTVGTDCDDSDASINTAASEITGDNVDQDCDGTEICYVDSDGDGDGSTSSVTSTDTDCSDSGESTNNTDCDDSNSSVYVGATERVGDEIDSDCDGSEICYVDSDSDGYGSTTTLSSSDSDCSDSGESTNDEDCDDSQVLANPGETEICDDGIDNDCSGEFEDCGPYGDFDVDGGDVLLTGSTNNTGAGSTLVTGDFDGDGQADLFIGAPLADDNFTNNGTAYLHLGPITSSGDIETDASVTLASYDDYSYMSYRMHADDLSHDGKDDLVLSSLNSPRRSYDYNDGNVFVLHGPISSDFSPDTSGNYQWWAYGGDSDYFGWSMASGDLDNDGYADLVIGSLIDEENGYRSGTSFLFVGPLSGTAGRADTIDDAYWTGDTYDRAGSANAVGDLNGDGVDDWIIGAERDDSSSGSTSILFGPVSSSGNLSSSADVRLTGSSSEKSGKALFTGDWDGDGVDDLAIGAPEHSTDAGRVYVVLGPITSGGALSTVASTQITGNSGEYAGSVLGGGCDVDGDGENELLIGAPEDGNGGNAYLFLAGFSAGSLSLGTDEDARFSGDVDDEAGTGVLCLPDQNGDGNDEIAIGSPYDGSDEGEVGIFFGGGE